MIKINQPLNILGIVPVRNRKQTTLDFLTSMEKLDIPVLVELDLLVIDDGSTDGTATAIRCKFPKVIVDEQDGSLYWSGAIQHGLKKAIADDYDFIWLLNDDMVIHKNCLSELLNIVARQPGRVYSGTIVDEDGRIIYGGIVKRPCFRFRKVVEEDFEDGIAYVDTLNGNCALLSKEAIQRFDWPKDGTYVQEGFDMYIGLEASRLGVGPIAVRGATAVGTLNNDKLWFYTNKISLINRLKGVIGVKGVYPRMYWDLCRRFAGPLFLFYFLKPYFRSIFPWMIRL